MDAVRQFERHRPQIERAVRVLNQVDTGVLAEAARMAGVFAEATRQATLPVGEIQHAVATLARVDNRILDDTARAIHYARLAFPTQEQLLEFRRILQDFKWAGLEFSEFLSLLPPQKEETSNAAEESSPELGIDSPENNEQDERLEVFRLRMFIYNLLENTEDWPPEDWEFPYFGRN